MRTRTSASRAALAGVSISASQGVTTILGPNGAGKTSLLPRSRPCSRSMPVASRSTVSTRSIDIERVEIRRRLGYLPQDIAFSPRATAFDVVDYLSVLKGWRDPGRDDVKCGSRSIVSGCRRALVTAWAPSAGGCGNVWVWPKRSSVRHR